MAGPERDREQTGRARPRTEPDPSARGVVFVNPSAGKRDDSDDVRRLFAGHEIVECDPADFAAQVEVAAASRPRFVAVAGGDGSMRTAAQILKDTDIPLLPVPAGTKNHFAKDVGNDTLERAAEATGSDPAGAPPVEVDLGEVNGHCFLNNSSIGIYPKIVIGREARQHRLPKGVANAVAVYDQLRRGKRFHVELDGKQHLVWMVFVGNGCYGEGLLDLADRESLDDHVLDVRIVKANSPLARLRVLLALLLGGLARSPLVVRFAPRSVRVNVDRPVVKVALDGEVVELEPPLFYQSKPQALRVLAAPSSDVSTKP